MIHVGDISLYTKAGLLRHRQSLYNWRIWGKPDEFWRERISDDPAVHTDVYVDYCEGGFVVNMLIICPIHSDSKMLVSGLMYKWVFPAMFVWRIQRVMREFLRRKLEKRALAVAMCWHARLGSGSLMACLDTDVMRQVLVMYT